MTLRLVRDEDGTAPEAALDPLQLLQETTALCRDQLDDTFDRLRTRDPESGQALTDLYTQLRNSLVMFENNIVVLAFRGGRANFNSPPAAPPT